MINQMRFNGSKVLQLAIFFVIMSKLASAQDLESTLSQKADLIPASTSTKEQLIELAKHYKIPMGIEWINLPDEKPSSFSLTAQPTVKDMIHSIIRQVPGYKMEINNGVINIAHASFTDHRYNFLNLRITEYRINKGNVFGAESLLRSNIHRTLHPERYLGGSNGGYGYGVPRDDNFDLRNISFSGNNLTVRDILNRI